MPLVALGGLLGTAALTGAPVSPALAAALAAGAWAAYLAERVALPPEDAARPDRQRWIRARRSVLGGLVGALAALAAAAALWVPPRVLAAAAVPGVLALAYALPGAWRVKQLARAKPLLIGGAWAWAVVVLPGVAAGMPPADYALLALARTLFYAANAAALDWPDRAGDAAAGLPTWAVRLDARSFGRLVCGCALASAALGLAAFVAASRPALGLVDAAGALLLALRVARRLPTRRPSDALVLDVVAAWPLLTWVAGRAA